MYTEHHRTTKIMRRYVSEKHENDMAIQENAEHLARTLGGNITRRNEYGHRETIIQGEPCSYQLEKQRREREFIAGLGDEVIDITSHGGPEPEQSFSGIYSRNEISIALNHATVYTGKNKTAFAHLDDPELIYDMADILNRNKISHIRRSIVRSRIIQGSISLSVIFALTILNIPGGLILINVLVLLIIMTAFTGIQWWIQNHSSFSSLPDYPKPIRRYLMDRGLYP